MNSCILMDPFTGKHICALTRDEARVMEERGTATCVRKKGRKTHFYRLVVPVQPSNSAETAPMLTVGDMRALVTVIFRKGCISVTQAERLAGWGFHVKKAMCDACEGLVRMPHPACV